MAKEMKVEIAVLNGGAIKGSFDEGNYREWNLTCTRLYKSRNFGRFLAGRYLYRQYLKNWGIFGHLKFFKIILKYVK